MKIIKNYTLTFVILSPIFFLASCATSLPQKHTTDDHSHMHHDVNTAMNNSHHSSIKKQFELAENAVTLQGENGFFNFSLYTNHSPIPISKIHDWIIHIETKDGKPVENAKVFIFGGMPMHNHEFPTVPRIKDYLGDGNYRIEGLKFNMIGHWEMHFTAEKTTIDATNNRKKKTTDRVEFKVHL